MTPTTRLLGAASLGLGLGCGGLFVDRAGLQQVEAAVAKADPDQAVALFTKGGAEVGLVNPVCGRCLGSLADADPAQRSIIAAHALTEASCACPSVCGAELLDTLGRLDPVDRMARIGEACDARGPDPLFTGSLTSLRRDADPLGYLVVRTLLAQVDATSPTFPDVASRLAVGLVRDGTPNLKPTPSPLVVGGTDALLTEREDALRDCAEDVAHRLIVDPSGAVVTVVGSPCVARVLRTVTLPPSADHRALDLTWALNPGRDAPDPSLVAGVSEGPLSVRGGTMSQEAARQVIRRSANQVRYCYQRALGGADAPPAGALVYDLAVGPSGEVTDVGLTQDTMHAPAVSDCVAGRLRRLLFTAPTDGAPVITVGFTFQPAPPPAP